MITSQRFRLGLLLGLASISFLLLQVHNSASDLASLTGDRREAVVTVLSSGIYLPGALVLGWSLRKYGGSRDFIALVPNGTLPAGQAKMLTAVGWTVQEVARLPLPQTKEVDWRFEDMLVKLYAFKMNQYKTIALVDADAFLVNDIEEGFELLHRSSAPIAASMAATQPTMPFFDNYAGHFNGGVIFLKPNLTHYQELVVHSQDDKYYNIDLAEQNLLNVYFGGQWLGLPATFDLLYMFRDRPTYWNALRASARVIHFAGLRKPWHDCEQDPSVCEGLHKDVTLWRKSFRAMAKDTGFKACDFAGEEEELHYTIHKLLGDGHG